MLASLALAWSPMGPYAVKSATFSSDLFDPTNPHLDVVWPDLPANDSHVFPFISYAHGYSDRGLASYGRLLPELASHGYVVAAPLACRFGCIADCESLWFDPPCFGHYYHQQLFAIDWSRSAAAEGLPINASATGIAGHSMGGQATIFSAAFNASSHGIGAAVMHHPFTHVEPPIVGVPFALFTGTADDIASPTMCYKEYAFSDGEPQRALVDKVGAVHSEPSRNYNPYLGLATAAWFKVHLDGTPDAACGSLTCAELIYGAGAGSLCGGGDGRMRTCKTGNRTRVAAATPTAAPAAAAHAAPRREFGRVAASPSSGLELSLADEAWAAFFGGRAPAPEPLSPRAS